MSRLELFPEEAQVPAAFRRAVPVEQTDTLVGGALRPWDGPRCDVMSPICLRREGRLEPLRIGGYPLLTEHAALEALAAAVRAWDKGRGPWPTMTVAERIRCVEDFAARMAAHREDIVALLMWEIGKPLEEARKEFDRTLAYVRDTVDALKELDRDASRFVLTEGIVAQIRRAPLGVTLCMGPFNYPLNETFTTLIPALIMGNTVVFKPPKLGVLLHRPLLEAFRDSFPPGVVNTVYGEGQTVVSPMMASGEVDVLAFIGSSRVADILKRQHPRPHHLRGVLGLEAKNPAIVLPDADLDLAVAECVAGSLSFNGQRCTALKILFVHAGIADAFLARLAAAVEALPRGMPWEDGVRITPLPEIGKTQWLAELVADARGKGARVVNARGGEREATFFHPAVLYPVTPAMRLYHVEQFGPVVPVVPFADLAEPIRYIVESPYGQQVSVFSRDPEAVARLVDPLVNQVCRVNLNSQCQRGPDSFPFTGRKASAEGTLSVRDALRAFSIRSLVAARESEANLALIRDIVRERRSTFLSTEFLL